MKQERLFKTKLVPGKEGSDNLFDEEYSTASSGPVTCLGLTFENDEARRVHFTEELRKKLQDPEFRKIEGFPHGADEDILNLSDPPYYTACPNPWLGEFIAEWEERKPPKAKRDQYHREPLASDVREGKNDPIYRIPSYHTKVPPKAIEKYLLHYTDPGDIILDGFSGSGMVGVACTHSKYQSYDRNAILLDLSPFATFMASVMCSPLPDILRSNDLENWLKLNIDKMYRSSETDDLKMFDYSVWSYWGKCPECNEIFRLYDLIVDYVKGVLRDRYQCPNCLVEIKSRNQKKAFETIYDPFTNLSHSVAKNSMVLISEKKGNQTFRRDCSDWDNDNYKDSVEVESNYIPEKIPYMHMTHERNNLPKYWGITHINHFYTNRNYSALSKLCSIPDGTRRRGALFCATRALYRSFTKRNRFHVYKYSPQGSPIGPLSNTLYVPTLQVEANVSLKVQEVLKLIKKHANNWTEKHAIISTQSVTNITQINASSVDFIFTDPPFGGNINYSEQNYLIEWWLKVFTNNKQEAITNTVQYKGINEYQKIMTQCFQEYYRVLKPGRWMVVEFHNSSNSIWTAIQQAIEISGFVVSTVDVLDKVHSTLHQDHNAAAVDKDLAITVYKPDIEFEKEFNLDKGTDAGVWDFIDHHLGQLPTFIKKGGSSFPIVERQNYLLFDRMIAFHVQRGYMVPISSPEFYVGLSQRYPERDGMFFLPEQVAEYDKKIIAVERIEQLSLFVSNESTAIQWLRSTLLDKPQSYQNIYPSFIQETQRAWNKNEVGLELSTLLEQNFLLFDGKGDVPEQIHSYLSTNWKDMRNLPKNDAALVSKAKDRWYIPDINKIEQVEKVRQKDLLRQFETYKNMENIFKKTDRFRIEAVRAGFNKAWQDHDYATIISVADKLPSNVLEEDSKLLMWYDHAITRIGEE
jgi:DNA modification methylase